MYQLIKKRKDKDAEESATLSDLFVQSLKRIQTWKTKSSHSVSEPSKDDDEDMEDPVVALLPNKKKVH